MNKDFNKWTEDVKRQRAPESIHNQIDNLTSRNKFTLYFKRTAVVFGLILSMLVVAVNVSDKFYTFAQDNPYLNFLTAARFVEETVQYALDTDYLIDIDKKIETGKGVVHLKYLLVENNVIMLIFDAPNEEDIELLSKEEKRVKRKNTKWSSAGFIQSDFPNHYIYLIRFDAPLRDQESIAVTVGKETFNVNIDGNKILETKTVEINEVVKINDKESYTINKIEVGTFSSNIFLSYPENSNIIIKNTGIILKTNEGLLVERSESVTYENIHQMHIPVGYLNMKLPAKLYISEVTWNTLEEDKGTINLNTGEITNLHPDVKFMGVKKFEPTKSVELSFEYVERTNLQGANISPYSINTSHGTAYSRKENGITKEEIILTEDITEIIEFTNSWSLHSEKINKEIGFNLE